MKMNWKVVTPRICGLRTILSDSPTQDITRQEINDDFSCVVVADGVGSALYALEGAQISSLETIKQISSVGEAIFEYSDDRLKELILDHLYDKLSALAAQRGCPVSEFASTLMFFITDGEQYIAANLGDGLVGSLSESGDAEVLHEPEKGRFVNQSYFVTSHKSIDHLRLHRGRYEATRVYFLMTDGSVECLYNYTTKRYARALEVYCDWVRKYDRRVCFNAMVESMRELFKHRTDDDCALAFIYGSKKSDSELWYTDAVSRLAKQ